MGGLRPLTIFLFSGIYILGEDVKIEWKMYMLYDNIILFYEKIRGRVHINFEGK